MSKSVTKEKPQAPAGTEAQGKSVKTPYDVDNKLWEAVCPCPVTPGGCYDSDEFSTSEWGLTVAFTDYNDLKLRSADSQMRLLIDGDFNENASNRILACLSFFRWNGKEYEPASLIADHDDLKYVVLGNIIEIHTEPLIHLDNVEELTERLEAHKLAKKEVNK